jgi:5'-nucleotidase
MQMIPDLVVSGINYGENLGTGITISGTVGAALEGASYGIPAIAASLKMDASLDFSYSRDIDFKPSGYFTAMTARMLLEHKMPPDVDLLKLEVPEKATVDTPWRVTKVARNSYYHASPPKRDSWSTPSVLDYSVSIDGEEIDPDSDIQAVLIDHVVSITPISLDMTSRVDLRKLDQILRS